MTKKVTIRDIAREAGVSVCCVSWVLGNHPRSKVVSEKTRQRILDAAAKLGYVQNQLAAATRTGQVNTIAVILDFSYWQSISASSQIMTGLIMEASCRKYSVKVFSESDLAGAFQSIVENRIGKVISMSVDPQPRETTAELAEKFALELVYAYERGHRSFPAVNTDNVEMTSHAVHYLAERGHSRIGLFCTPHTHFFKIERHDGYLKGLEECGLSVDPRWIVCSDKTDAAIDSMLDLPDGQRPTAFIAATVSDAVRAQHRAWKRGLRIPEDFSVIGIGDTESSRLAMLPVTVFRESLQDTGELLVRLVLGDKPDFPPDEFNVYRTHAELIERQSVCDLADRKSQVSRHKTQVTRNKQHKSTGKDM